MDTPKPHLNPATLAFGLARLVRDDGLTKSEVARRAEMTPANLREYETGLRAGTTQGVRKRIAEGMDVDVAVLTCWCHRPDGRCVNAPFVGEVAA